MLKKAQALCGQTFEAPEGTEPVCPICGATGSHIEEVKETKRANNTIVAPMQKDEEIKTSANNNEDSDVMSDIFGLGLIGGGSYWGYNKYKKAKNKG